MNGRRAARISQQSSTQSLYIVNKLGH
jgi:hypothetical protein